MWSDRDCISPLAGHTLTGRHSVSSESRKAFFEAEELSDLQWSATIWKQVETKALVNLLSLPSQRQTGKLTRQQRWKEIQQD